MEFSPILYPSWVVKYANILSIMRLKSKGLNESPCLTPLVIEIDPDIRLIAFIFALVFVFKSFIFLINLSGTSLSLRQPIISSNLTRSKDII